MWDYLTISSINNSLQRYFPLKPKSSI